MKYQIKLIPLPNWQLIFSVLFAYSFSTGCTSPETSQVDIVFAFGPDDTNTIQTLIDQFNETNKGKIKVSWNKGSRFSNAFYHEIKAEFESGDHRFDVIGADVIWTPDLAMNAYVEDLTKSFFDSYNPQDFLMGAMNSVSYQFKVWGVPWYTDAGMLYYRKDILKENGYEYPPVTWEELIGMSKKIMANSNIENGYVFQGADYEGGVTNACEFIWNAGGEVLLGDLHVPVSFDESPASADMITINSQPSRRGFSDIEKLVYSKIVPSNIHEFREREAAEAFGNGQAIFMRSWASAYGHFLSGNTKVKPDQIGLTSLPVSEHGKSDYSCLGGWNLMISASSSPEKKAAALEFISFMTAEASQKFRALKSGSLPSLRSLYQDEQFLKKSPVTDFARNVLPVTKERPRSPFYMELSPEISSVYSQLIKQEMRATQAIELLERKMEEVLNKHQEKL